MIQTLRQIKSRIRSIENTKKLTRAMEMISITKLRRTRKVLEPSVAYFLRVERILKNLTSRDDGLTHPLFRDDPEKEDVALLTVTSDTGLCSAYNHALIAEADAFCKEHGPSRVQVMALGRKGFTYFKKRGTLLSHAYVGHTGRFSEALVAKVLEDIMAMFLTGDCREVYAVYPHIASAARYNVVIDRILPLRFDDVEPVDYLTEPDRDAVIEALVPMYMRAKVRAILLHAFTAEHQARSIAMGEATQNAVELLEKLVLLRNKVRQANITKEMLEIISSTEALKG